jgi:uncharacterized RDD family membrane protein YckC
MPLVAARDARIASLPIRAAAGAIDGACMVAAMAAVAGAVTGFQRLRKRPAGFGELIKRLPARDSSSSGARALAGIGAALSLVDRNVRTPGKRVLGLRRVDAISGGPVQMRSVVIASLLSSAEGLLVFHLFVAPRLRRLKQWSADVEEQRTELRTDSGDARSDEQRLHEMVQRDDLPQRPSCLAAVAPLIAQLGLAGFGALRSTRRQTPNQRLAGTIIVRER